MNENLRAALKMHELHHKMVERDINHWLEYELLSWNWWILFGFAIIPWIIWLKFSDRKRRLEIILIGTLATIPTTYLDALGVDLSFWIYPVQLIPIAPRAMAFDMSMVSVTYMLIYQFFFKWKSYIIALLIMSLLFAFIGEPVSKAMNLTFYIRWKYWYSFLYYIALGITIKFIVEKCKGTYRKEV
ncbi:CBO0543 family protein [Neobacillus drentensis]|uniref:CBO0543 family protein n=1 Tax=Neobacillus drentensis TaxID=220684 RepID=UPI003000B85E